MTIKSSGSLSLLEIQNEFGGTAPISLNEYYRGAGLVNSSISEIPASGAIDINSFYGKTKFIAGAAFLNSAGGWLDYTLPATSGPTITIILIGAGGGGGGGTGRTVNTGPYSGGGGGGAGECRVIQLTGIPPGSNFRYYIGVGGSAGGARDGGYSGGSSGTDGGGTYLQYPAGVNTVCYAGGGLGGTVSQLVYYNDLQMVTTTSGRSQTTALTFIPGQNQSAPGGGTNTGYGGSLALVPERGETIHGVNSFPGLGPLPTDLPSDSTLASWPRGGGYGGAGYDFYNSNRNITTGARSIGARGNDQEPWSKITNYKSNKSTVQLSIPTNWAGSAFSAVSSQSYGAGGGGGGKNNEYLGQQAIGAANGTQGAISIYWDAA